MTKPFLVLFLLLFPSVAVSSRVVDIGPVRVTVTPVSWKGYLDKDVVRQNFDYSCGASSLATILKYYHNIETNELDVLQSMDSGNAMASFLDLAKAAEDYGLRAVGLSADFASLLQLRVPVIVYVKPDGWDHFVVVRGIDANERVWLADPSYGNRLLSRHQFLKIWLTEDDNSQRGRLLAILSASDGTGDAPSDFFFVSDRLEDTMRP